MRRRDREREGWDDLWEYKRGLRSTNLFCIGVLFRRLQKGLSAAEGGPPARRGGVPRSNRPGLLFLRPGAPGQQPTHAREQQLLQVAFNPHPVLCPKQGVGSHGKGTLARSR